MKKMMKTLFVSIYCFISLFSANAGDLAVTGNAKASYNLSGQQKDNGIGWCRTN